MEGVSWGCAALCRNSVRVGAPDAVGLPAASSANSPEAPCLVEAFLFSSRSEELSVPQFTEDSGPLHLGLEAFQKLIAVFSVTECYMCQIFLLQCESCGW